MPASVRSRTSRARARASPGSNRASRRCARRWPSASTGWRCSPACGRASWRSTWRRVRIRRSPRRCRSAIRRRCCAVVRTCAWPSAGWRPRPRSEGVAAADLFPRVTVTGVLGFLAGRGSLFGTSDSRQWAVTPSLTWAAFDLGSARARLRGTEAVTRETLASYEQTVLRALEETENALVSYREQQRRLVSLVDQARESGRAASIARVRYKRRPRRLPAAARRRAHGAAGAGSRGAGGSRRVHRRRGDLQVARRDSEVSGLNLSGPGR